MQKTNTIFGTKTRQTLFKWHNYKPLGKSFCGFFGETPLKLVEVHTKHVCNDEMMMMLMMNGFECLQVNNFFLYDHHIVKVTKLISFA
jgi:hypothetical protein